MVILFIRMKDEKYGLLSYLKNYFIKILITLFIAIYLFFCLLLLYFWLSVLSLFNHIKKYNQKRAREIVTESRINLTGDLKAQNIATTSGIQLIPLNLFETGTSGESGARENGKFFILHV